VPAGSLTFTRPPVTEIADGAGRFRERRIRTKAKPAKAK
jgi:hypothetical protein